MALMEQRTALINRICGLLSELGIVLPLKAATVRREAHKHLEDLLGWCNTVVGDPYLRILLIMGAKAVVAVAAKNARMCWAMLQRGNAFKLPV